LIDAFFSRPSNWCMGGVLGFFPLLIPLNKCLYVYVYAWYTPLQHTATHCNTLQHTATHVYMHIVHRVYIILKCVYQYNHGSMHNLTCKHRINTIRLRLWDSAGTAYCIWSVISCFSNLHRWSSSVSQSMI